MGHYTAMGILLGLSAGLSPGPLLTLVISETLAHGTRAGVKVALAPLATDLPIVMICLFILSQATRVEGVLGLVSLAGGVLVFTMGVKGFKTGALNLAGASVPDRSLAKGMAVNFLSPHPYFFWISVGGPAIFRAWQTHPAAAAGYVIGFYLLLVGSKALLAVLVGKSRSFLAGVWYVRTMKALGVALCGLSLLLLWEGAPPAGAGLGTLPGG